MAKRVKIPGRLESAETGNIVTGADAVMDDEKGKTQVVINSEVDAAIINLAQGKQDNLTFDSAPTEDSPNPVTSGGVYAADKVLSDAIEAILLLIPSAASALNKLVDMQTMNSSIATATASFKGTYNLVSDLHLGVDATHEQIGAALDALSLGADNNDYAFVQVPNSATAPTEISKTERYKYNGENWLFEYDLNNSGFTQGQWNAINSGVTSLLVIKLSDLPTNAELTALLAGKQDNLTFDNVPTAGSPNPVKSGGVYARNNEIVALINALDAAKQDVLTFDNAPVEGSPNPVKSGGVYTAISAVQAAIVALDAAKQNVLTFDSTPTLGSPNPVTSSGIKTELNRIDGNITTLNDLYEALTQSALVVVQPTDTWPVASPATSTIYRVVDRVNTPPQYYSDYMWNGMTMVLMATYDNAIDDEPTENSNNLVKSAGVYNELFNIRRYAFYCQGGGIFNANGEFVTIANQKYGYSDYVRVIPNNSYHLTPNYSRENFYSVFYNSDKQVISVFQGADFTTPANCYYIRISTYRGNEIWSNPTYILPKYVTELIYHLSDLLYNNVAEINAEFGNVKKITYKFEGSYYVNADGVRTSVSNNKYGATDYIEIEPGTLYKCNSEAKINYYNAFYDKNHRLISVFQSKEFTTPSNARYVIFSVYRGDENWNASYSLETVLIAETVFKALNKVQDNMGDMYLPNMKKIICWGDSLTQGAGQDVTRNLSTVLSVLASKGFDVSGLSSVCNYPLALQALIGDSITVSNEGVGGESVMAIACREGSNPAIVSTPFILPANRDAVNVNVDTLMYAWDRSQHILFSWQGNKYNPCFIGGIPCTISKVSDSVFSFSRNAVGDRDVTVAAGESILFKGATLGNSKIVVIWVGENGGFTSTADYIEKVKKMIKTANAQNYIVIGSPRRNPSVSLDVINERRYECMKQFGSHFFDLEQYITTNALLDFGITPTTDADFTQDQLDHGVMSDVYCMANGFIPSSLWRYVYGIDGSTYNDLHFNAAGYAIIGYKIYEMIQNRRMV